MISSTSRNGRAKAIERFDNWPRSLAQEASILGGVILRNDVLAQLDDLEVDDFYDMKHRIVFSAMRALAAAGRPIDVVTLEAEVEKQEKLDAIGGVAFFGELALKVPTPDNVVDYAAQVKLDARNRRAIIAIGSTLERAKNWPHEAHELIGELAGELQRIEIDHAGPEQGADRDLVLTPRLTDFLGAEADEDDRADWIIRDLVPRGEPVIWGGPMKAGKTWGVMDLALAIALGESWLGFENTLGPARVLGLFLEDNKRRIDVRMSELARGRGRDLRRDEMLGENLSISRAPVRWPSETRSFIRRVRAFAPAFIVIDNLTRIFEGDPKFDEGRSSLHARVGRGRRVAARGDPLAAPHTEAEQRARAGSIRPAARLRRLRRHRAKHDRRDAAPRAEREQSRQTRSLRRSAHARQPRSAARVVRARLPALVRRARSPVRTTRGSRRRVEGE
jgi:hypothetical protein